MYRLSVLIPVFLVACESSTGPQDFLPDAGADVAGGEVFVEIATDQQGEVAPLTEPFSSPEGVAVTSSLVFVASTAFDSTTMTYGDGFITVVRRSDLTAVNKVPTSRKNPQVMAVSGDKLYVLCSGETAFDTTTYIVSPKSEAALDIFELGGINNASGPSVSISIPLAPAKPLVGYPSSLVVSEDGKVAYMGSGTTAAVFKIDLIAGKVVRGPENPITLGDISIQDGIKLSRGPEGSILAGSFNRDLLFAFGPDDKPGVFGWESLDLGKTGDMEGVQDLVYRPEHTPDLFALMGISSSLTSVSIATGQVNRDFAKTGLYPNRILLAKDRLLVVNSGDNNVTAIDPDTGESLGTVAVFPPGTNPYDIAVDGEIAYVTGFASNSLFEVDLEKRAVVRDLK